MPSNTTLLLGFVCAAFVLMSAVLFVTQGEANEDGLIIAVFPPTARERAIMASLAAADASLVRTSLPRSVVVVHSDGADLRARLVANGAWLTYSRSPFGMELAGCMALSTVPFEPANLERWTLQQGS